MSPEIPLANVCPEKPNPGCQRKNGQQDASHSSAALLFFRNFNPLCFTTTNCLPVMKHFTLLILALCLHAAALSAQTAYEIWFTAGSVRHHGLILAGNTNAAWQMRVKYHDTVHNCTRLIEQQLRAEETSLGIRLYGHSVWDVVNQRQTRDYAADRLYVYRDPQGNMYTRNLDDQGISSGVVMKPLNAANLAEKMREFEWN